MYVLQKSVKCYLHLISQNMLSIKILDHQYKLLPYLVVIIKEENVKKRG